MCGAVPPLPTLSGFAAVMRQHRRTAWAKAEQGCAEPQHLGRLCPPYEAVNLSIFSIPDLSQIKDLADVESAKTGKIHILYGLRLIIKQTTHTGEHL
jgi:hypothetical protein